MNNKDWLIEQFVTRYPGMVARVVDYRQENDAELRVVMDDGNRYIFNTLDYGMRYIEQDFEHMSEERYRQELGTRLRYIMWSKGVTQAELSSRTGISQPSISAYIKGRKAPSSYAMEKIIRALGCSMDDLRYVD
jgi:predicted XRE-type DNA-binding protein